ncbi:MAG: hypothetical protein EOO27_23795 [Comamonadaceae bacterium]|nr:MAG: hypothetical protein EOO27_23795 [Comamonadaceae bacterium]
MVRAKDGKAVKHEGIKVEFVGSIGTIALLNDVVFQFGRP